MAKVSITYHTSDIIPSIYFFEQEDAEHFDKLLKECLASEVFITDFKQAENQYASEAAVIHSIQTGRFPFLLKSELATELIVAREAGDDPDEGEFYEEVMMYVYNTIHNRV